MLQLTANECRVLGTLIEKAQTTPAQYPLTLNSLTTGCNQKNNREPVTNLNEETVYDAVDSLRRKGLMREVMLSGSRVQKFRHVAREVLNVTTEELCLLAELMLRGPQSIGSLRGNASRMAPEGLATLEQATAAADSLIKRDMPLAKLIPPPPGSRAALYVQLLCPDLHAIQFEPAANLSTGSAAAPVAAPRPEPLQARVAALEAEVAAVRAAVSKLAGRLGESDPFAS
jgi:uncharacterized protein YceH (UPF0502 family)